MSRLRYVGVALVAGTIGAAVALLLAPDTGRNTRRRIAKRLDRERQLAARRTRRMVDEAEHYIEGRVKEATEVIDDRVKRGRKMVESIADQAVEQFEQGKKKVNKLVG